MLEYVDYADYAGLGHTRALTPSSADAAMEPWGPDIFT